MAFEIPSDLQSCIWKLWGAEWGLFSARIARNPEIKFSKDERFERPLRLLISANEQVETFKEVLDIVFKNSFEDVDGFTEFKKSQLSNDKSYFLYYTNDFILYFILKK